MEKSLFEQMGCTYTQVREYLPPNLVLSEEKQKPIGIWRQRHVRYLKQHHKVLYMNLLTSGKLSNYLADIDKQAKDIFSRLVDEIAINQSIAEQLKAIDQIARVGKMNIIRNAAMEIVNQELIFV